MAARRKQMETGGWQATITDACGRAVTDRAEAARIAQAATGIRQRPEQMSLGAECDADGIWLVRVPMRVEDGPLGPDGRGYWTARSADGTVDIELP